DEAAVHLLQAEWAARQARDSQPALAIARAKLQESLGLLAGTDDWVALAATTGFLGRLELFTDNPTKAVQHLTVAAIILRRSDNRHIELTNLLQLSAALAIDGQPPRARRAAFRAW